MSFDRYGHDVLATDWKAPRNGRAVEVVAEPGMVVEEVESDWCGAVVRVERDLGTVELEDRHGRRRTFPLGPGFWLEGKPVILTAPRRAGGPGRPRRTASGSVAVHDQPARVARASRIYVEGRHDAELVEKVWGDDLRVAGVVVEYLGGVDELADRLAALGPGSGRRAGVLVDHLVAGSKEARIATEVTRRYPEDVLVTGHPFIDVWQAVKPASVGIDAWPSVPRSEEWKHGVCERLGWPHRDQADIAAAWQRILAAVTSYADLEPALLGRVEELIDFVTATTDP